MPNAETMIGKATCLPSRKMGEPNIGLELTAYSVRSFLAPASSSSSGPAFGKGYEWLIVRLCLSASHRRRRQGGAVCKGLYTKTDGAVNLYSQGCRRCNAHGDTTDETPGHRFWWA
jgi:hypothetical protein